MVESVWSQLSASALGCLALDLSVMPEGPEQTNGAAVKKIYEKQCQQNNLKMQSCNILPVSTSCCGLSCGRQRCAGRAAQQGWGRAVVSGTEPCGWSPCRSKHPDRDAAGPAQCGTGTPRHLGRTHPTPDKPGPMAMTYCIEWRSWRKGNRERTVHIR